MPLTIEAIRAIVAKSDAALDKKALIYCARDAFSSYEARFRVDAEKASTILNSLSNNYSPTRTRFAKVSDLIDWNKKSKAPTDDYIIKAIKAERKEGIQQFLAQALLQGKAINFDFETLERNIIQELDAFLKTKNPTDSISIHFRNFINLAAAKLGFDGIPIASIRDSIAASLSTPAPAAPAVPPVARPPASAVAAVAAAVAVVAVPAVPTADQLADNAVAGTLRVRRTGAVSSSSTSGISASGKVAALSLTAPPPRARRPLSLPTSSASAAVHNVQNANVVAPAAQSLVDMAIQNVITDLEAKAKKLKEDSPGAFQDKSKMIAKATCIDTAVILLKGINSSSSEIQKKTQAVATIESMLINHQDFKQHTNWLMRLLSWIVKAPTSLTMVRNLSRNINEVNIASADASASAARRPGPSGSR